MTPYERVAIARSKKRMKITDYIDKLFTEFVELKGDRLYREDPSILGGIAFFHGHPVTVIGHRKGRTTEENIRFNFGMTQPEGYRKAARLMRQAEKFNRPIITFVDTPGAYPGIEAESNGQSNAIAENLALMSTLKVPVITVITGEGGSGGALALAASDRVYMLENSVYSILSPEGIATILWKDGEKAHEAAKIMKMTAEELFELGLIDGVIREDKDLYRSLDVMLRKELSALSKLKPSALLSERLKKYTKAGRT